MLLGVVIGYAVAMLIQFPANMVSQVMVFRDLSGGELADPRSAVIDTLWLTVPSGVLASLAQLAVTLYLDFVIGHLYLDQRRRREGWDLEVSLSRLESTLPGAPA